MIIYFVRHAQSKRNAREESSVDAELTKIGIEQAKRLGFYFKKIKIDAIFCSPLIRTRDTLKAALPYLDHTPIKFTEEVVEHKIGVYGEGKKDDLEKYKKDAKKSGVSLLEFKPKRGESYKETYERAGKFYEKLFKKYGKTDKKILIVSHGSFGKYFISNALNISIEEGDYFGLSNASISMLDINRKGIVTKYKIGDFHHIVDYALKHKRKL